MELIDALEQSWNQGTAVIAGVTTAHLEAPTGCAGWDVRALLNHTLGEAQMMTEVNRGEVGTPDPGDLVGDGGDLPRTWTRTGQDNVSSWRESGLAGERSYFYGTFPAPASAVINLGEVLVHTWDLARATGQPVVIDPELATLVHGLYSAFPLDGMRAGGQLGAEVEVPANASIADRLLGLLGRRP